MTDKELLELAAKAAGIAFTKYKNAFGQWMEPDEGEMGWNPLTDDGDALRLAVKLHINFRFPLHGDAFPHVGAGQVGNPATGKTEPHDPDPYAATRRAIVRAAAEIGKEQK